MALKPKAQGPLHIPRGVDHALSINAVYYHSLRATQGNAFNIFSTATFGQ
jgi:hypothetical protein